MQQAWQVAVDKGLNTRRGTGVNTVKIIDSSYLTDFMHLKSLQARPGPESVKDKKKQHQGSAPTERREVHT